MTAGDFFQQHRKAIDARKADLARVGIVPPGTSLPRDVAGSQADVLTMPTLQERALLDATHEPMLPRKPGSDYKPARSPLLEADRAAEE